jgi:hypothetical protein
MIIMIEIVIVVINVGNNANGNNDVLTNNNYEVVGGATGIGRLPVMRMSTLYLYKEINRFNNV